VITCYFRNKVYYYKCCILLGKYRHLFVHNTMKSWFKTQWFHSVLYYIFMFNVFVQHHQSNVFFKTAYILEAVDWNSTVCEIFVYHISSYVINTEIQVWKFRRSSTTYVPILKHILQIRLWNLCIRSCGLILLKILKYLL